jgi:signal transduction histidine kinase
VTALGKLVRTTAFKLSLVYLIVFALFAAFLLTYFAWNTRRLITEQITQTVNTDVIGLTDQFRVAGLRRLVLIIDNRSRRPGSNLYLVTLPTGEALAGNVSALNSGVIDKAGWSETTYRRAGDAGASDNAALVHVSELPGGYRLLVGRDLDERHRLDESIWAAGQWSIALVVVLGLLGGFFITRRVLKRVDAMTASAQQIMSGNLGGRLPTTGSGDELDRLAEHLNAMLERIEALMHGLKEVSDNIAHDLKTPLTRLRNRSEAALRAAKSERDYRAALETTIEESDGLIRTFNALLMIARAEAGQARDNIASFDAAEIARDIGELYEPVAEEKGIDLKVAAEPAMITGNRELISQALANLVDNAIKYAAPGTNPPADGAVPQIVLTAANGGERVFLSVGDGGPGIPQADRARAVERFVRLETSRTQPGSGLGLSLASAVARLHGGELRLEDNAPGLRAVMEFPRSIPPAS